MVYFTECEDHNKSCKDMATIYEYCTTTDAGINVWMKDACPKSCGYCFNPGSFETDIDKYVTFIIIIFSFFII